MIQKTDSEMHIPEGYEEGHSAHTGPILAIIVLVLVLILGGLFLWGSTISKMEQNVVETPIINNEPETPRAEADVEILEIMSPSDELDVLEADISNTNIDSLNTDLDTIDVELRAIFSE